MISLFKMFGLKKARKVEITEEMADRIDSPGLAGEWADANDYYHWLNLKREADWKKKFAEEGHTLPERFMNKPIDDEMDREQMEDMYGDFGEHFDAQEEANRPEANVPIKGRGLPKKYYSDKPVPSAEGEIPGRTDFLDEKQYTKRPKGQTLADKRAGRSVINMLNKAFKLNKNKADADEYKKKTPNGGENGD